MTEHTVVEHAAPPAGEEVHLPGPSLVPIFNAAGISLALLGLTFHWVLIAIGLVIFFVSLIRWIGDSRRELDELPLEH